MLYPIEFLGEFIILVVCLVNVWDVMNWSHCRRIHALMQWMPRRKIAFEPQCDTIYMGFGTAFCLSESCIWKRREVQVMVVG